MVLERPQYNLRANYPINKVVVQTQLEAAEGGRRRIATLQMKQLQVFCQSVVHFFKKCLIIQT